LIRLPALFLYRREPAESVGAWATGSAATLISILIIGR
jgi:hypothetical protein